MSITNLRALESIVDHLGGLADRMVFVGGITTGLLLTDPAAPPLRTTKDVDAIVEVAGYGKYQELAELLRKREFREDTTPGAPLCRWRISDLLLDVMPTDPTILGFSNRWFSRAVADSRMTSIPGARAIRIVSPVFFLATKIEAFLGRGKGDFLASHDMEDLVALLDGRPEIVEEVTASAQDIRGYLAGRFGGFLADRAFRDALPGHLPPDAASQARLPLLDRRMKAIAGIAQWGKRIG